MRRHGRRRGLHSLLDAAADVLRFAGPGGCGRLGRSVGDQFEIRQEIGVFAFEVERIVVQLSRSASDAGCRVIVIGFSLWKSGTAFVVIW